MYEAEVERRLPYGEEGTFSVESGPLRDALIRGEQVRLELLVVIKGIYQYLASISDLLGVPGVREPSPATAEEC